MASKHLLVWCDMDQKLNVYMAKVPLAREEKTSHVKSMRQNCVGQFQSLLRELRGIFETFKSNNQHTKQGKQ